MKFNDQSRECHAEPMRFAQGKLREGSRAGQPDASLRSA
jgi:hypothetical protein